MHSRAGRISGGRRTEPMRIERFPFAVALVLGLALQAVAPTKGMAQFGNLKKRAAQAVLCGGGAYAGYKIGAKIAEIEAKRLGLAGAQADRLRRSFQLGTALVLCRGGAL